MSTNPTTSSQINDENLIGVSEEEYFVELFSIKSNFSHLLLYPKQIVLIWLIVLIHYLNQHIVSMVDNHLVQTAMKDERIGLV
jgi:hypothetical protein